MGREVSGRVVVAAEVAEETRLITGDTTELFSFEYMSG